MSDTNKTPEVAEETSSHVEPPPSYTPRVASPKPAAPRSATPVNVHTPQPPFNTDLSALGPEPANVICPRCHYGVVTSVHSRVGTHAGVWSAICCLTCGIVAAIVPLLIPNCRDVDHTCPHCGFLMARYRRAMGHNTIFPVGEGYVPVAQDVRSADVAPQDTGVTQPGK